MSGGGGVVKAATKRAGTFTKGSIQPKTSLISRFDPKSASFSLGKGPSVSGPRLKLEARKG